MQWWQKFLIAVGLMICTAFLYIEKMNELTELRLEIPTLKKELKVIEEENTRLQYDIDRFESPLHLMELSRKPEFGHLKYPYTKDVIVIESTP